jgi:membrane protein
MGGKRGIVKTRALSFSLYCAALVVGIVVLPLVLAGPSAVADLLPQRLDFLNQLYWPVVTILSAGFLNTLYHLSVPVRTPWVSDLPGSFLALSIWVLGSFILRWILQSTVGGTSIYGPLAAPIAVLMWLYMTAIAVLIGAALNAVVDRLWPTKARRKDRAEHAPEPMMKAEAEPHETEDVPPSEERPEARMARAAEALAEPDGQAEVPERTTAPSAPEGLTALEQAPPSAPAVAPTAPTPDPASGDEQSDERSGQQDPGRKPAAVGKPRAPGDSDDIR